MCPSSYVAVVVDLVALPRLVHGEEKGGAERADLWPIWQLAGVCAMQKIAVSC